MRVKGSVYLLSVGLLVVASLPANSAVAAQPQESVLSASDSEMTPNNRPRRAGSPARWIQHPYLKKKDGRFSVKAKIYVDPFKSANPRKYAKKAKSDTLRVRVVVAKKKFAKVGKPRSTGILPSHGLAHQSSAKWTVTKRGPMSLSVKLSKKASKRLAPLNFKQRSAAMSIVALHTKDTMLGSPKSGLKQVVPIELTKSKFSSKTLKKNTKRAKQQVAYDRGQKAAQAGSDRDLAWNGNTPFYNSVYVQNWSPFAQNVSVNPNIECMWTGATPNSNQQSTQANLASNSTAQFVYVATSSESNWPGLNGATNDLNAPGTQGNLLSDLSNAATATENNVIASLENPATYSESGAATAAASAGLTFLGTFISGLFDLSTCDSDAAEYPELFGVSTQVVGFGTNNVDDAADGDYTMTSLWNGQGEVQAGSGEGPSSPPTSQFVQDNLAPMMGAQTVASYYWNGGQPAPMVSNNSSGTPGSGGYNGGSATYEGGLFQFAGVNPGSPGSTSSCTDGSNNTESCTYDPQGSITIQLQYLTNPNLTSGLWNQGGNPSVTVTENQSTGDFTVSCDLSALDVTLSLPFGYNGTTTNAQSATLMSIPINSSNQLPENGNWLVNFFGIANTAGANEPANYVYVYSGTNWQGQTPSPTGGYTVPGLGPNADYTEVSFAAASSSGSETTALGTITPGDLTSLYTSDGTQVSQDDLVAVGCNATPSVQLPGLSMTAAEGTPTAEAFGAGYANGNDGWPMPGNHTGWPTTSFTPYDYDTNWEWQWPVNQLNVTFQGLPSGVVTDDLPSAMTNP